MRVSTVTTFFPHAADRHRGVFVENLVRAMRRRCEVDVIAPVPFAPPLRAKPEWYRKSQIPRRENIDGIDVEHPRFVVFPKAEVLSGMMYAAGVLPALRRARDASPDLIVHAHCAYPDGVGVALAARRLGIPYVVTAHGSDVNVYAERRTLRGQIRWALRGAAATIAVSRDLLAKVTRLLASSASSAPLVHIPCAGFDPAVFRPRDRAAVRQTLGLAARARLVVFVGQLVPIKGIDRLVEAWRLLDVAGRLGPDDRLVIIGAGRCGPALARQVGAAGIEARVVFAGALAQPIVAEWVGAADVLCLPSDNEGTPNVVVEALASGVPVVASHVGGVPELVTHERNGLLVPPRDPAALMTALAAALERRWDPEQIRATVAHATWEAIADRTIECLRGVRGGSVAAVA
ncbi:MAG TPA: glycosyltransferase [Polyangia bacterium]|jgi:glycosyltransferase involved in cell wall biosynthesis|nr:glycosyltransferase [Polyangia bacterium]